MFNKILLAAAVGIGGMMFADTTEANADNCYRGRGVYTQSFSSFSPYRSAYRYAAPRPIYTSPYSRGFGYGYGGYGVGVPFRGFSPGFGPGFGYGSPYYGRGTSIGFGRGGVSIGIGF